MKSAIPILRDMHSIEEALKMLSGTLKASVRHRLNRLGVQRSGAIASISKMYKERLANCVHYRDIERKLKDMKEQNTNLNRGSNRPKKHKLVVPTSFTLTQHL